MGECRIANARDAITNGNTRQRGAKHERLIANARDAIADGNARQRGATRERITANACDAIGDDNRCNGFVAFECLAINGCYRQTLVLIGNVHLGGSACVGNYLGIGAVSGNFINNAGGVGERQLASGATILYIGYVKLLLGGCIAICALEPVIIIIKGISCAIDVVKFCSLVFDNALIAKLAGDGIVAACRTSCRGCDGFPKVVTFL